MNVMEELRKKRRAYRREVLGQPIPPRIGKRERTQIAKIVAKMAKGWTYTFDDLVRDFMKKMERQINATKARRVPEHSISAPRR